MCLLAMCFVGYLLWTIKVTVNVFEVYYWNQMLDDATFVADSRARELLHYLIQKTSQSHAGTRKVVRRGLAHCLQSVQGAAQDVPALGLSAGLAAKSAVDSNGEPRTSPLARMQACRDALTRLDGLGWNRSFHQRLFHEDFLVS